MFFFCVKLDSLLTTTTTTTTTSLLCVTGEPTNQPTSRPIDRPTDRRCKMQQILCRGSRFFKFLFWCNDAFHWVTRSYHLPTSEWAERAERPEDRTIVFNKSIIATALPKISFAYCGWCLVSSDPYSYVLEGPRKKLFGLWHLLKSYHTKNFTIYH